MNYVCYFCGQPVVSGEHHAAEDCRSWLKEQRDALAEQVAELEKRLAAHEPAPTGG